VTGDRAKVVAMGRYGTDKAGYAEMLRAGRKFGDRVWAVEGCNGAGRHIAHRLVADGETVLDVPARLSAQVRVFATGNGRKTDPAGAHSVALAALRAPNLVQLEVTPDRVALGLLADRRDELGRARTQAINRIHRLLLDLVPGGAKRFLSAAQARALLAATRPRDIAGKTRRRLAAELITELEGIDRKIKACRKQIQALAGAQDSTLPGLHGIGPSGAARLLADVGQQPPPGAGPGGGPPPPPPRDHFASWNGTAPLDASSGQQQRHRLSRAGNRPVNRALHIMAVVQLRSPTEGRAYYDARKAAGKTSIEAMRCLKRRLSNVACRQMLHDQHRTQAAGPGGHSGTTLQSSVTDLTPDIGRGSPESVDTSI
jgi:hypothetical protein